MPALIPSSPPSRISTAALTSPSGGDQPSFSSASRIRTERRSTESSRKCRRKRLGGRWREAYLQATQKASEGLAARKTAREAILKSSEDRPDFYEFIKVSSFHVIIHLSHSFRHLML